MSASIPALAARFDLHLHSNRSDGAVPPEEVLARAAAGGLDVIALTDHDLTSGLAPGPHQVGERTVHVLMAAEITGQHEGEELHLLVYFPGDCPDSFRAFCTAQSADRAQRYAVAVERIGLPGLAAPDAEALAGKRALTRHHLARALVTAGHAPHLREAFARYAGHGPAQVPPIEIPFVECIRLARAAGGVTSWAHPFRPHLEKWLPTFAAAGLHAIEVLRPSVNGAERRAARKMARAHGLVVTGGSDWHGWWEPELGLFAVHRSELTDFLEALAEAA